MDLLLTSMSILKARKSGVPFLVMGFPEQAYRRKAHDLGLDEMVTFTGRIDYGEAAALICAGDLAISPKLSLTEANGKLFNYMACGLPTLVFETPVNREILGSSGEYAVYGDAADLANRITGLLADRERLARLSRELREKAVSDHSWSARAVCIAALYRRLLGS
jgi:glycosyltransferase involved in cell wall biosynthesis